MSKNLKKLSDNELEKYTSNCTPGSLQKILGLREMHRRDENFDRILTIIILFIVTATLCFAVLTFLKN